MLLKGRTKVDDGLMYTIQSVPATPSPLPSVVLVSGLGDTASVWLAVLRQLGPALRTFAYDRLGLGRSDKTDVPRTAATLARELKEALVTCEVPPPYLLVLSSYAGIIGREFLALWDEDVAGMVCVDANQEHTLDERHWPDGSWENMVPSDLATLEVTGLDEAHGCTEDEWEEVVAQEESKRAQTRAGGPTGEKREGAHCIPSLAHLASHKQLANQALGARPLSVIQANLTRDLRRLVDAGKAQDRGTVEDHTTIDNFLKRLPEIETRLHEEVLRLSSVHRLVVSERAGHLAMLWDPALVVGEIEWCLEQIQTRRLQSRERK